MADGTYSLTSLLSGSGSRSGDCSEHRAMGETVPETASKTIPNITPKTAPKTVPGDRA